MAESLSYSNNSKLIPCPDCQSILLSHIYEAAHGIPGAYIAGSERYECECGRKIYRDEGIALGLDYIYDR